MKNDIMSVFYANFVFLSQFAIFLSSENVICMINW